MNRLNLKKLTLIQTHWNKNFSFMFKKKFIIIECSNKVSCPCYKPLRNSLMRSRSWLQDQVMTVIIMYCHQNQRGVQDFTSIGWRQLVLNSVLKLVKKIIMVIIFLSI